MGTIVRQSIYSSIISYLGIVVGYVNLLYLYPRFLSLEQIGLLRAIQDSAILIAPFAQLGLSQTIIRYYPQFDKDAGGPRFINLVVLLAIGGYGLFLLIFLLFEQHILTFFEDNASAVSHHVHLILWLTFILMMLSLMEFYARSLLKLVFPNLLREIGIRLMQAALVSVYFLGFCTFQQFLVLSVVLHLVTFLILVVYLAAHGHIKPVFSFSIISGKKLREVLVYSLMSFIGSGAMMMIGKLDSIMVTAMVGLASNAVYTTAFYMATVIEIPKRAIGLANATLISRAFERNDLAEIASIYKKTAINQFIIGSLLLIGIWCNLHNIFALIPKGAEFEAGTYVVLMVGIAKLTDMLAGPNGEILVLSKYYWFNSVALIAMAAIAITGNYLLIPEFGIEGAAAGTIAALVTFNLVKAVFIYIKLDIQPFGPVFFRVAAIIAVTLVINYLLPQAGHVLVDILYRSAIITLVFGGLVLATRSSEEITRLFVKGLTMLGWRSK